VRQLKIASQQDWVEKTAKAAETLIKEHGFHPSCFHVCTIESEPSLSWCEDYPENFKDIFLGKTRDWISREVAVGVTLHWPDGVDFCGEAYDPQDPIDILAELEFWKSPESEDWARKMLEETPS
jgi:hypothetical protein